MHRSLSDLDEETGERAVLEEEKVVDVVNGAIVSLLRKADIRGSRAPQGGIAGRAP